MADVSWRRDLLAPGRLADLCRRSDARGLAQLATHLAALALTGYLLSRALGTPWLAPAAVLHGVVLIFLFSALHECIHHSAFRRRRLNRAVAWACGAVIVLPPLYFRYFHLAHHRWTQDARRDPELATPKPETLGQYILVLSGLPYWRERLVTTLRHARGRVEACGFLPAEAAPRIVAEARRLWALYAAVAIAAVALGSWAPVVYWLAPAIVGQPFLRLYLLAEHTGRPLVPNMLENSRTTRTNRLARRLAWNMPYHVEHHAFPSVPFHALPRLHRELGNRLGEAAPGYIAVHAALIRGFARAGEAGA